MLFRVLVTLCQYLALSILVFLQVSFASNFKQSIITPLLKKPSLDKENVSNYRPISNLSTISKIIERVVKSRLTDHLTQNTLFNPLQSAILHTANFTPLK